MSRQLSGEDARQPMAAHAAAKGREIRGRYGCRMGWKELLNLLEGRAMTGWRVPKPLSAGNSFVWNVPG